MTIRILYLTAGLLVAGHLVPARADVFFQGFETNNNGWNVFGGSFDATRVASGTHGVTSATGSFHAEVTSGATNWGGYNTSAPASAGFYTSVDIYLNLTATSTNDTRFDWDSAVNDSSGNFLRDFAFNGGFYNDTDITGSGARFVITASNNTGRANSFPKNPARDPFAITQTGWYTFQEYFHEQGGFLDVTMTILDASSIALHTWDLGGPPDAIGLVGGNRYGWMVSNEFPFLAIDNSRMFNAASTAAVPEPASLLLLATVVGGLGLIARRKRSTTLRP